MSLEDKRGAVRFDRKVVFKIKIIIMNIMGTLSEFIIDLVFVLLYIELNFYLAF